MGNKNLSSGAAARAATRVIHVVVTAELHKALLLYEAEHGLIHREALEAALTLLLEKKPGVAT